MELEREENSGRVLPTIQNPSRCRNSFAPTNTEHRPGPVGSIELTESQFCFLSSLERHETRQAAALATTTGERITGATVTPRPHNFDLEYNSVGWKCVKRLGGTRTEVTSPYSPKKLPKASSVTPSGRCATKRFVVYSAYVQYLYANCVRNANLWIAPVITSSLALVRWTKYHRFCS